MRLIDADETRKKAVPHTRGDFGGYNANIRKWAVLVGDIDDAPTVDAIPMDDIKLHYILIDNEGVPEVKLQIGDRYFIMRTDPVDVREVVHGRWEHSEYHGFLRCSKCKDVYIDDSWVADGKWNYCPNCGAKMDGDGNAIDNR